MANSKTVYVIHAADGKQHLGYLQQILKALKKENRIDNDVSIEGSSVTKDTFTGIEDEDMVILLLTDEIVPIQDQIEGWLVSIKKGKLVEVLVDKHTYHLDFKVFPDSFEAIRGTEDMDGVWQQIGGSLREVYPVREDIKPPAIWKKWIPYIAAALVLGALIYFIGPIIWDNDPKARFSYRVLDPVKGDVISGVSECYLPCKVLLNSGATNYDTLEWELNDTIIENEEGPEHVFIESGNYEMVLKAFKGEKEAKFMDTLTVKAPPLAGFEVINDGCTAPCEIEFKNTSENATKFKWSFVSGTSPVIDENRNPSKRKYNTQGTFDVQLFIENEEGIKADVTQKVTVLKDNSPFAGFTVKKLTTKNPPPPSQKFRFTNVSKNATQYRWEINKGATLLDVKTVRNFDYTFNGYGTYSVKLTVTGNGETKTTFKNIRVTNNIFTNPGQIYNYDAKVLKDIMKMSTKQPLIINN